MKKLSIKNLKVVKISDKEKYTITGGVVQADTSGPSVCCGAPTGPYVSWCNSCG
jgi:hypothetical protein